MARKKIRGHGIPEALEAILIGRSRIQPKVGDPEAPVIGDLHRHRRTLRRRRSDDHDGRRAGLCARAALPPLQQRAQDAAGGRCRRGLIEPRALGVGYDNITALLHVQRSATAVARLLLVKAVIWSIAPRWGTSVGVLAPLLLKGGSLGALFGRLIPPATPHCGRSRGCQR